MIGFVQGLGFGLLLCVLIGPIFFKILQTSIERGKTPATVLAAGQWLGDLMYISLVWWGAKYIETAMNDEAVKQSFMQYVGGTGAVLLAIFGLVMLLVRPPANIQQQQVSKAAYAGLFAQGFIINTINPFPIFFWLSLMAITIKENYSFGDSFGLFVGTMGTVVGTDWLKIYLAVKIQSWLRPEYVLYIRRLGGLGLLIFAALLCWRAFGG